MSGSIKAKPLAAAHAALAVEKAKLALEIVRAHEDMNKARWPAGAPGSKGGQFAPSNMGGGGGGGSYASSFNSKFFGKPSTSGGQKIVAPQLGQPAKSFTESGWAGSGKWSKPKGPPPGSVPHPKKGDKGEDIHIEKPSFASPSSTWSDPKRTATFIPGGKTPSILNGVEMKSWTPPKDGWSKVSGTNEDLEKAAPFEPHPTKKTGAGVLIVEPDGRVWLTKPTNEFGGYANTYPKGTAESGLSLQQNAIKEAWEETGLKVQIVGVLGDYERDTSKARMYIARRVGGTPADMGWESQAIRLAPMKDALSLLNRKHDKEILGDLEGEYFNKAAKASMNPPAKFGSWMKQERWPAGSSLGGQWKAMGKDGITLPPTIAGGAAGKNSIYQKAAEAAYRAVQAADLNAAQKVLEKYAEKAVKFDLKEVSSTHVKWGAQVHQYAMQAISDYHAKLKATASADKISGPEKLSGLTKIGSKPGGSNPGGMYQDASYTQWLIKGNAQLAAGNVTQAQSDDRAKNEVLSAKLLKAVGAGAPDMKLVDLGKEHGGGLGVASKWETGAEKFNPSSAAHKALAQSQFAVHAWLANYDVLGMGYDNTVIKDGKAMCIDPGGALLFRAQGLPKSGLKNGVLDPSAPEFESMRNTTGEQKNVFGSMTAEQLKASASHLQNITNDDITKLANTYGPGDAAFKAKLAENLIARRKAILDKVGLGDDAAPAPAPVAAPAAATTRGAMPPMPEFKGTVYKEVAEEMSKLSLADLQAAKKLNATGNTITWGVGFNTVTTDNPPESYNGKTLAAYHDALVAAKGGAKSGAKPAPAPAPAPKPSVEQKAAVTLRQIEAAAAELIKSTPADASLPPPKFDMLPPSLTAMGAKAKQAYEKGDIASLGMAAVAAKKLMDDGVTGSLHLWSDAVKGIKHLKHAQQQAAEKIAANAPKSAPIPEPQFQGETASYYGGLKQKVDAAAATGNLDAMMATTKKADGKPSWPQKTVNGKLMQAYFDAKVQELKVNAAAQVVAAAQAAQAAVSTPVPDAPKPGEAKGANPAMPNFEKFKLPETNSNAGSHNGKIDQISSLAAKGDAAGIAALAYGTNTYGKQQAKLANSALAALGSSLTVTPGQKKNANPGLLGGNTRATVVQASATVGTPPPAPHPATTGGKPDMTKLDVSKVHAPPKPLFNKSSKPHVNEQNNALAKAIETSFQQGNYTALTQMKFDVLDKESGKLIGQQHMSEHPAKDLKAYYDAALAVLREAAYPPKPLKHFDVSTANSLADIAKAMPGKKFGTTVNKVSSNEKLGFWVALGKVSEPEKFMPAKTHHVSQAAIQQGYSDYQKAPPLVQAFINGIQASGAYNDLFRNGKKQDFNGNDLKEVAKAALEFAQEKPEGTTVYRWQHMSDDMIKKIKQSGPGTVFQATGSMCTSMDPTATKHFGPHRIKIVYAKGAKAVDSFGSGGFKNEKEITTLPNARFMIQKVEEVSDTGYGLKRRMEITVLMLPPDNLWIN